MSRNISEICLEIGKTVKRSGASAEASIKVDELLVEIVEAKNEVYLQGRTDQKHEDEDIMIVLTKHEIEVITKPLKDMIASLCAALNSTSGCECCPYFHKAECLYNNGKIFIIGSIMSAITIIFMWILYFIFCKLKDRKLLATGIAFFIAIPFTFIINITLSRLIGEAMIDIWDILSSFILFIVSLAFIISDYARKKGYIR